MFIQYKQNGLTLLEMSIGLTVIALAVGATVAMYKGDTQKAKSVITQLQMAKAGVLRYNMDNPSSTNSLASLLIPNEENQANWNGPYVDNSIRMDGEHFDISKEFPDTRIELTTQIIGSTRYQAVIIKGSADSQLRNEILAQCGNAVSQECANPVAVNFIQKLDADTKNELKWASKNDWKIR